MAGGVIPATTLTFSLVPAPHPVHQEIVFFFLQHTPCVGTTLPKPPSISWIPARASSLVSLCPLPSARRSSPEQQRASLKTQVGLSHFFAQSPPTTPNFTPNYSQYPPHADRCAGCGLHGSPSLSPPQPLWPSLPEACSCLGASALAAPSARMALPSHGTCPATSPLSCLCLVSLFVRPLLGRRHERITRCIVCHLTSPPSLRGQGLYLFWRLPRPW